MRSVRTAEGTEPPEGGHMRAPAAALDVPSAAALARAGLHHPSTLMALQGTCGNRSLARLAASGRVLARDTFEERWAKAGPGGDKVYELIASFLTPDEISGLLDKVPDATGDAAKSWGVDAVGLSGDEASKLVKGGTLWAKKAADKWLKSDKGKDFLTKARAHIGRNADIYYDLLANIAVSAVYNAAFLYANGKLDPPNLEKSLKLSKSVTLTGGIDLGKLHSEFPVQGAKLGFGYKFDPRSSFSLESTLSTEKDKGYTWAGKSRYTLLGEDLKVTDFTIGLGAKYGFTTGIYGGDFDVSGSRFGAGYGLLHTPGKGTAHTFTGRAEVIKKALILNVTGVAGTGGAASSIGGGVSGKAGGFDYKAEATWNLSTDELSKLTLHLGYTSKDETLKWLADFAYEAGEKGATVTGKAALSKTVKDYVFDIEANGTLKAGTPSASLLARLTIPLPHDFKIAPSLGFGYGATGADAKGPPSWMFSPGIGLGHKDMPVMPNINLNVPLGGGAVFPSIGVTGHF